MQRVARMLAASPLPAALAVLCLGCASAQKESPLTRLNLPSPWATIKAADSRAADSESVAKTAGKNPALQEKSSSAADSQLVLEILRGKSLERSGDYDKARKLYEELRRQHPGNLEVIHRLGVVADAERRHAEAEGMFQYVLQREPHNAEVLADLGYCYFLQGQLLKAESALAKAVAAEPTNSRYRNNLGLAVGHQGRYDEALAHFRAGGTEADAFYNLAFIYATQEQADKAKQCFLMALNEDPTHGKSREALRSFEEYERLPEDLRDDEVLAGGRVKYVPYVEGSDARGVQAAVANRPLPTSRDASQTTRALLNQSRGMLERNMQSQRNDEQAEFVPQ